MKQFGICDDSSVIYTSIKHKEAKNQNQNQNQKNNNNQVLCINSRKAHANEHIFKSEFTQLIQ